MNMIIWYEEKIAFHKLQQQLAHDAGKDKAAANHETAVKNYEKGMGNMGIILRNQAKINNPI